MAIVQRQLLNRKTFLIVLFIFSVYHLVRDIFQEILSIHNPITDFLHFTPDIAKLPKNMLWVTLGGYGKWVTFPMELFFLTTIPKAMKRDQLTFLDITIVILLIFLGVLWVINFYYH